MGSFLRWVAKHIERTLPHHHSQPEAPNEVAHARPQSPSYEARKSQLCTLTSWPLHCFWHSWGPNHWGFARLKGSIFWRCGCGVPISTWMSSCSNCFMWCMKEPRLHVVHEASAQSFTCLKENLLKRSWNGQMLQPVPFPPAMMSYISIFQRDNSRCLHESPHRIGWNGRRNKHINKYREREREGEKER